MPASTSARASAGARAAPGQCCQHCRACRPTPWPHAPCSLSLLHLLRAFLWRSMSAVLPTFRACRPTLASAPCPLSLLHGCASKDAKVLRILRGAPSLKACAVRAMQGEVRGPGGRLLSARSRAAAGAAAAQWLEEQRSCCCGAAGRRLARAGCAGGSFSRAGRPRAGQVRVWFITIIIVIIIIIIITNATAFITITITLLLMLFLSMSSSS